MAKQKNNLTDEIMSLFFASFRSLKQKLDWGSPLYHLPLAQMETLRFVEERRLVPMKEVADFLSITPPSATVVINTLVRLGYLKRQADPRDRRAIKVSPTKRGLKVLRKGLEQRCRIFTAMLGKLSKKEQGEFVKILRKMTSQN